MENKIQELADKLLQEGVAKGDEQARQIVENAKAEAKAIVQKAQEEAETVKAEAQKHIEEQKKNMQSELQMFAAQALGALKSEVATMLTNETVSEAVKGFTQDKEYVNKFIVALASKWSESEGVVIGTADAEALKKYFAANAKALLDKGVKIEKVDSRKALFTIAPENGSYKVTFGQEELENYFKTFLRPQLVEMLF